MSSKFYPNGTGGSLGEQLGTCKPLITSGNVWYVSSLIGTDAASPAGQNREKPLATMAQAMTNSADDDIIVFLTGHTETLSAAQSVTKRLALIGEGTTSGKPSVKFNSNAAAASVLSITALNVELRNLYFPEAASANSQPKLSMTGNNFRMVGCYFEQGAKDSAAGLSLGANGVRIESTTFISTGVLRTAQPFAAIKAIATSTTELELTNVVVSAGTVGFSNYSAIDLSASTNLLRFRVLGLSLLLGADMDLANVWTGYVNNQLSTGGSRVSAP